MNSGRIRVKHRTTRAIADSDVTRLMTMCSSPYEVYGCGLPFPLTHAIQQGRILELSIRYDEAHARVRAAEAKVRVMQTRTMRVWFVSTVLRNDIGVPCAIFVRWLVLCGCGLVNGAAKNSASKAKRFTTDLNG